MSSHVPEAIAAERYEVGKMNPDIVMVEDAVTKDSRGTIHIIEVGHCWDPNKVVGKTEEKEQAYAEVVAALEDSGWKLDSTVLPIGATGVSVDFLNKEARDKLGLTWKSYETFRRAVAAHSIAALQDMWVYRCMTVQALENSRHAPDR